MLFNQYLSNYSTNSDLGKTISLYDNLFLKTDKQNKITRESTVEEISQILINEMVKKMKEEFTW